MPIGISITFAAEPIANLLDAEWFGMDEIFVDDNKLTGAQTSRLPTLF